MINSVQRVKCDECYGHGVIFYGDANDYSVEPCECVAWYLHITHMSNAYEKHGYWNTKVSQGITKQQTNRKRVC